MKPARILILSASHLCRNPRVVKEATTLGAAGYDVTVLTVSAQERFEQLDRALLDGRSFRRETLDLRASGRRFRDIFERGATWSARWLVRLAGWETAQALGPAGSLLRHARRFPADLVIAHTEIPTWAVRHLHRDGQRFAVDLEDWYSQDLLHGDRRTRPLRLLREAEAYAMRHARYVSTTSRSLAEALATRFGGPIPVVLRNTFPLQRETRLDRPPGDGPVRFIWFSQTVGPGRGLELFLAAWSRMLQPTEVHLLGDPRTGYRERLLQLLPPDRHDRLRFIPLVPPDRLPGKLAEFDVGLALELGWPANHDLTIANKIFQYMNAGLAVVATDTAGQTEAMQAAPRCGLLVRGHETTDLARRLDAMVADRAALRAMQASARTAAEELFCWEREAPTLLAAVERALHEP